MDAQSPAVEPSEGARPINPIGALLLDEADRLAVLEPHGPDTLLDDSELKAAVDFAGALCEAPIALVSLVEADRQRFLARCGLDAGETPRSSSFCQYAMVGDEIYVVTDARADARFADNPLVTGEPNIRFYAGAPLRTEDGAPLGALCVISPDPRPDGLSALQRQGLKVLAKTVMRRLNDRRVTLIGESTREALEISEGKFAALANSIPSMAWSTDADGIADYFNARWFEYTGLSRETSIGLQWLDVIHPDDRKETFARWEVSVANGTPYDMEYRIRGADGQYRWCMVKAIPQKDEDGKIVRWFGTTTDIHERLVAEQQKELLGRELSHRIKNIFSVVNGLVSFEARSFPELKPLAQGIRDRIASLGRAHDYVRPLDFGEGQVKTLHGLLGELFGAYVEGETRRVLVRGDDLPIGTQATTPLALVFHELATNAAKYGALSRPDGSVDVEVGREGDQLVIHWREQGGPAVATPGAASFGTSLIDMSVTQQLRGTIDRQWGDGLTVVIRLPGDALA